MPISYNYKIIFIHVPKCAGTSIETALQMRENVNFYTEGVTLKNLNELPSDVFTDEEYRMCASKNKQHYTFKELNKILPKNIIDNYKKVSVVRNPFDRLVSEYYFCGGSIKIHKNFEDFIKKSLKLDKFTRNWLYDGHLETQTSYLINEEGNFNSIDRIFKYEELNLCIDYIKNITGSSYFPHARKSLAQKTYEEHYTPELKQIVYEFYKEDFVNFNY